MISKGYTLIELMVVVAIIGIISAIAYPSYQGYTCDTYKGQAIADLNVCALGMERYYSNNFSYAGAVIDASAASVCPNISPTDGQKKYNVSVAITNANQGFLITAATDTGTNSCSGGGFTLDEQGTVVEL